MEEDLWNRSTKLAMAHIAELLIMAIIFIIIALVLFAIVAAVGMLISPLSGAAALYAELALAGLAAGFMLGWYVSSMYLVAGYMHQGKKVNYVDSVVDGFRLFAAKEETLVLLLGLGFLAGLISIPLRVFTGSWLPGLLVSGAAFALAAALALLRLHALNGKADFGIFNAVNKSSPECGLFVYAVVLISIVPWIGPVLQFVGLPLATVIITAHKDKGAEQAAKKQVAQLPQASQQSK